MSSLRRLSPSEARTWFVNRWENSFYSVYVPQVTMSLSRVPGDPDAVFDRDFSPCATGQTSSNAFGLRLQVWLQNPVMLSVIR